MKLPCIAPVRAAGTMAGWLLLLSLLAISFPIHAAESGFDVQVTHTVSGEPIAGVEVRIGDGAPVRTGADGRIRIPLPATPEWPLEVTIRKPGFSPMKVTWNDTDEVQDSLHIRLPPSRSVGGRVQDQSGNPIEGATILLNFPEALTGPRVILGEIKTDSDGRWRCDALPEGIEYIRVEVTHPDYLPPEGQEMPSPSLEELYAHKAFATLNSGAVLRGQVVDESGKPIPVPEELQAEEKRAWIEKWFWSEDGAPYRDWLPGTPQVLPNGHTLSAPLPRGMEIGEDGTFEVDGLTPGDYRLMVTLFGPDRPHPSGFGKPAPALTHLEGSFSIPEPSSESGEDVLDLGRLELKSPEADSDPSRRSAAPNSAKPEEIEVNEPKGSQQVTAGARLTPAKIQPGETAELRVKIRIAEGCHIYAMNHSGTGNAPTRLTLTLPEGLTQAGEWEAPPAKKKPDGSLTYADSVVFTAKLQASKDLSPGSLPVECEVNYQVCNEALCWPPATIRLGNHLEVVKSP